MLSTQSGNPKSRQPKGCSGHLILWNKGKCLLTTASAHEVLDLQAMLSLSLSLKTMRSECCGMPVDASCWSIDVVWSPINKPSRVTCQPSMDVTVAYCSFTQRYILLLPKEFFCCPSHMCLLHMVSIEVCGNVGQEIGHGLKEYTGTRQQLPHF